MDELGAGFTLATHDLEIRGAGELLGEDQSGQMAEVGFSLYTELLERAVRSIKRGELPDVDAAHAHGAEVLMNVPARSEEHTSELQSLMRTSYAVFCLKNKKKRYN